MKLGLIYAKSINDVIGLKGQLPWNLFEDIHHFKELTYGHTVIMGRNTWNSIPEKFRPLKNRKNIVISRRNDLELEGATITNSLYEAIDLSSKDDLVWIIGGTQIFLQALPLASFIEVTEINKIYEGDTFMPKPDSRWKEVKREPHISDSGLEFSFVRYELK